MSRASTEGCVWPTVSLDVSTVPSASREHNVRKFGNHASVTRVISVAQLQVTHPDLSAAALPLRPTIVTPVIDAASSRLAPCTVWHGLMLFLPITRGPDRRCLALACEGSHVTWLRHAASHSGKPLSSYQQSGHTRTYHRRALQLPSAPTWRRPVSVFVH